MQVVENDLPHTALLPAPGQLSWALALALALAVSSAAHANPLNDTFEVSLGAFIHSTHTTVRADGSPGPGAPVEVGTPIDVERELGISDRTSFRLDGYWRFLERHKIRVMYFDESRSGETSITDAIVFRGQTYSVNMQINARFDRLVAELAAEPLERELKPGLQIPAAARTGPGFNVDAATEAYLGLLSPEQRHMSDRYFEGGYWLQLWQLLWTVGVCVLLVVSGVARRLGEWSRSISARRWISTPICITVLLLALTILEIPLSIYVDFVREHQYGLSEQSFAGWVRDQAIVLGVEVLVGAIVLSLIYAAVSRSGSRWWLWATGLSFVFLLIAQLIAPVYFLPLLNDYQPLPDGPVREAVLSLARANGVPTSHVEWFDESKQTTRVSANVAGLLGTTRIALNDNLLNKTSLPEIKAVLGHEMGHFVLNHAWKLPIMFTLVIGLAMWLLSLGMDGALSRWGGGFGLDRMDPASLPVAIAIFSIIFFALTPLQNLIVRTCEEEADAFGLNAAREPYGAAMAAMRLSTYRKLRPGRFEEFLFYDHPSGYERVHAAMIWLRENQALVTATSAANKINDSGH